MKILFAVHGYKPAYRLGGPILSVSSLAEYLVRKGNEVTVLATNSNLDEDLDVPLDREIEVDGVRVRYFKRTEILQKVFPFIPYLAKSSGFVYAPGMKGYLKKNITTFDLVHTHLPFIYPTFIAAHFARKHNKPLFYHQRGVFDPNRLNFRSFKKRSYIKAIEYPILRNATTLIALTNAEVDSYKKLGVNTTCSIVPNGIDIDQYRKIPLKGVFDITADQQVILFMGRIHPIKGADKLLKAFLRVHDKNPRALLVMAGPDEFGMEAKFKQQVRENDLDEKVLFPGMILGELKKDLLARADVFCLPSDAEGFSMAILEALASATSVLISPGCNFPEVATANAGVVVNSDSNNISESLIQLLSNSEKLKKMGENGYRLAKNNYAWDTIANEIIDVYKDGLERHRSYN